MPRAPVILLSALLLAATLASTSPWPQTQLIFANDGAAGDDFGWSLSVSGDLAVVGAPSDDNRMGAAYVFARNGHVWSQQAKLTAPDRANFDEFGYDVAISGDTIVVGARFDDDRGSNSGSAYIFVRSGPTWTQQAKLTASDGAANDYFGIEVAISGDTVVVGSPNDDDLGSNSGSAYVFTRTGSTWTQQAKLTASDGAAFDAFGQGVAVDGNTVVVGAWQNDDTHDGSGSAYVFTRSGTAWTQQAKLVAADPTRLAGLGRWVSVSGDLAVLSAEAGLHGGVKSGVAYVFARTGTVWAQEAKLVAADAALNDNFGYGASIEGNVVVVGAPYADLPGLLDAGAAYVFTRAGTTWTQGAKLVAGDAQASDSLAQAAAVSGGTIFLGAVRDSPMGPSTGSAYVFSIDSDGDGLYDFEETALGTNPHNPDTDGDGLTDFQEDRQYGTNPLNKDTDGDLYKDGTEVNCGTNPLSAVSFPLLTCSLPDAIP